MSKVMSNYAMSGRQVEGPELSLRQAAEAPAAAIRVLLVEDNAGFAYFIRDVLTRQTPGGFVIREVKTLETALSAAGGADVDVILLDLGLPDSARMDTFSRMRARAPRVPIIILTVLDDDAVALEAVRSGAQDYLVKEQVNKDMLVRTIRYAVERARADNALHELSARLMDLQDAERRRIARDLHDTTAQTLAVLSMNLALLSRSLPDNAAESRTLMNECTAMARHCSNELRTTAYLLHPPLLDELGLAGAVRDYCDGFSERSGIRVDLELPGELGRLPREVETTLFRVMQESLTNIHRHSGSPTASIRLMRHNGTVGLEVADAGRGMRAAQSPARPPVIGVGIAGMKERIRQLGGSIEISSGANGTVVRASLPVTGEAP